jgi:hypothetical protein
MWNTMSNTEGLSGNPQTTTGPLVDESEKPIDDNWQPSKHEKAIIYTLALLNLIVSLDATIVVTSLPVSISFQLHRHLYLIISRIELGNRRRNWWYHYGSVLDWDVVPSRQRRHDAYDLLHQ